jgi:hypothetical protein
MAKPTYICESDTGVVRCWRCDYNLLGLADNTVCPECGLPVRIARQEAPFTTGSRARKWAGIIALLSFGPLITFGFVLRLMGTEFATVGSRTSLYWVSGEIAVFFLASIAGTAAGWFMREPKQVAAGVSSSASMVLSLSVFLFLPVELLVENSVPGSIWVSLIHNLFPAVIMCAFALLSLQAKVLAIKLAKPKRARSLLQIVYIAFLSAGLFVSGALILAFAPAYTLFSGQNTGLTIVGIGVLLGTAAVVYWTLHIFLVTCQLARWPVNSHPATKHT